MPRYLHVLNGDACRPELEHSGVGGDIVVWADPLCEGPLPADPADWFRVRGAYHAGDDDPAEMAARLQGAQQALERWREADETVLWFEHDLFDQVLLVRHLAWFRHRPLEGRRLSLICIDHYPGVEPFHGLGQLDATAFARLFPERQSVTSAQLALGERAWTAFTAPSPLPLQALLDAGTPELPHLAPALLRYLQEYPDTAGGLSRTERTILEELRAGPSAPGPLFRAVAAREERVFMGDSSFFRILEALASGREPLVTLADADLRMMPSTGSAALTAAGADVLAGNRDRVATSGIDRWHGGVHLRGTRVPWRWDRSRQRITASPG